MREWGGCSESKAEVEPAVWEQLSLPPPCDTPWSLPHGPAREDKGGQGEVGRRVSLPSSPGVRLLFVLHGDQRAGGGGPVLRQRGPGLLRDPCGAPQLCQVSGHPPVG